MFLHNPLNSSHGCCILFFFYTEVHTDVSDWAIHSCMCSTVFHVLRTGINFFYGLQNFVGLFEGHDWWGLRLVMWAWVRGWGTGNICECFHKYDGTNRMCVCYETHIYFGVLKHLERWDTIKSVLYRHCVLTVETSCDKLMMNRFYCSNKIAQNPNIPVLLVWVLVRYLAWFWSKMLMSLIHVMGVYDIISF